MVPLMVHRSFQIMDHPGEPMLDSFQLYYVRVSTNLTEQISRRFQERMLCRSGILASNEIPNLKANIFVNHCSSCSSYCEQPPYACKMHRPTIAAMLETVLPRGRTMVIPPY